MANLSSIARPYAHAAFECARDKQQLATWKAFLESAACIAKNKSVVKILANPQVPSAKLLELFQDVLKPLLDKERQNFLSLLTQNHRLNVLPEISAMFNNFYAALEKLSQVRLVTAITAEQAFRDKFAQALSKRIQREVTLHCEVDPAIIGGAIIHIGDRVIDGSVRGKLSRLLQSLAG